MKSTTLVATLAAVVSTAFGLTINTPSNVVECQPTQFIWSNGTAPFYLNLIPAGQPTAPPIKTFPTQTGDSYTWLVDLQSGTSFTTSLKDGTGAIQYSDIVTITAGSSSSCVNTNVQETGSGSSGAASTASSASSGSSATTTASGSSSTQSSAAGRLAVSSAFGVAGIMGLVGAALF